jgi:2-polyprenyl-3-methyl-5-hydroxy-6-metoxy-1,4-benzoquinol methylase
MPSQLPPITNSSPERIAVHALIEGVIPPELRSARVVELASGEGENLVPMAFWLRETSFCGFDSAPDKTEAAQRAAADLGLENVRFTSVERELEPGAFDFVLVGNVLSHVGEGAKRQVLLLARQLLAPAGLLFIRYHPRTATMRRRRLREMLLPLAELPGATIGREIVEMMHAVSSLKPKSDRQNESQLECKLVQAYGPDAVLDHLRRREVFPLDPSEARALMAEHRLSFVGEMNNGGLESRSALGGLREWFSHRVHGAVDVEDLVDFYASPEYREEVYCHADHRGTRVTPGCLLDRLRIEADVSTGRPDVNLAPGIEVGFRTGEGRLARSKVPIEKALLKHLCLNKGRAARPREIIEAAWRDAAVAGGEPTAPGEEALAELLSGLIGLADQRFLTLTVREPSAQPGGEQVPAITHWQAERGRILSTARHELIAIDDLTRALVLELARGRAVEELAPFVEALVARGDLVFSEPVAKKDAKDQRQVVEKSVKEAVEKLVQVGLLRRATAAGLERREAERST